jgi:hypothetical protein
LQTAIIPGGTNQLKASFPGDLNFQASTSTSVAFTVQPATSYLTMATDKPNYNVGDPVTISATFSSSAGSKVLDSLGAAPTGTVTFIADASNQLGTASVTGTPGTATALAAASATFSAKGLALGGHNITATYSGDSNYTPSMSQSAAFIVMIGASTTITLTPSSSTIKQNQSLQLTANLSTSGSLPAPTGTVTFGVINNVSLMQIWSSAAQVSNGVATVTIPANALPLGSFTVSANYGGDNNYYGNTFATTGSLQVTGSGTVNPTLSLTLPSAPVNGTGLPIALTVSGPSGDPVPTGPVIIPEHNGSWTLVNGSVSFTAYYPWQPGSNTVTVTYLGDSTYSAASASGTFTEMGLGSVSVSPQNPTVYVGDALTLSVSVAQVPNLPQPTGTITLAYGSYTSVPTALTSGSASITIPANTLPVGSDVVGITYSGDAFYTGGSSGDLVQVTSSPPGFTLSGNNLTLTAGSTVSNTSTISITPAGGFTGQVTLTAKITAAPANAVNQPTLSFGTTSPVTISAPNGGNATLMVTTTAPTTAMLPPAQHLKKGLGGITAPALGCILLLMSRKRRRWQRWLGVFALGLAVFGGISACGGGGSGGGGGGTPGTTPGVYTITITGTSAQLTANTTISVTVN